jgi:hypothetical protein
VLPFFSPVVLAGLPLYFINVLGDPGCNSGIIFRHYALIPAILMLPGSIYALRWVGTRPPTPAFRAGTLALALLLSSVGTTILSTGEKELAWWRPAPWHPEATQVIGHLPSDAAVAVPRYMLPFVADREHVYQSLRLLDYHHPDPAYVVIDRDDTRMGVTATWDDHYRKLLQQLGNVNQFDLIYSSPNYLVYQRIGTPLLSLRPVVEVRGQ